MKAETEAWSQQYKQRQRPYAGSARPTQLHSRRSSPRPTKYGPLPSEYFPRHPPLPPRPETSFYEWWPDSRGRYQSRPQSRPSIGNQPAQAYVSRSPEKLGNKSRNIGGEKPKHTNRGRSVSRERPVENARNIGGEESKHQSRGRSISRERPAENGPSSRRRSRGFRPVEDLPSRTESYPLPNLQVSTERKSSDHYSSRSANSKPLINN